MNDLYKEMLNNQKLLGFDFPGYYRDKAENIKEPPGCGGDEELCGLEKWSVGKEQIEWVKRNFYQLLECEKGYQVLWGLNNIAYEDTTVLGALSDLFYKTGKITRGGINVYKTSGWMVHVLYTYQIVGFHIAKNVIPSYFEHSPEDMKALFYDMHRKYKKMSQEAKYILRLFALTHDIGVCDGIQHHDRDGEKYAEQILSDLCIGQHALEHAGTELEVSDVVLILRCLIANHVLINKIAAEDSDLCIREKCMKIKERLQAGGIQTAKLTADLPALFLLLGMADLMAVDDRLFTAKKYKAASEGYKYLSDVFNGDQRNRDTKDIAVKRLGQIVDESVYGELEEETMRILRVRSINPERFWQDVYDIYQIEYAMAYLKQLYDLEQTVRVLDRLFTVLRHFNRGGGLERCSIVFDSRIDMERLKLGIVSGELEHMTGQMIAQGHKEMRGAYVTIRLKDREKGKAVIIETVS